MYICVRLFSARFKSSNTLTIFFAFLWKFTVIQNHTRNARPHLHILPDRSQSFTPADPGATFSGIKLDLYAESPKEQTQRMKNYYATLNVYDRFMKKIPKCITGLEHLVHNS